MGDNPEENETGAPPSYEEVKAAVEPEAEPEEPAKPKVKPKAKSRPEAEEPKPKALEEESKPRVAKPAKNDKVECADCGKKMNANTLRYKHVCKPPKSDEIQKEKPYVGRHYVWEAKRGPVFILMKNGRTKTGEATRRLLKSNVSKMQFGTIYSSYWNF